MALKSILEKYHTPLAGEGEYVSSMTNMSIEKKALSVPYS
jgi:hypothetical protein